MKSIFKHLFVIAMAGILSIQLQSCINEGCRDGSLDTLYPRNPSPDNYCQLDIRFSHPVKVTSVYYPQVNQQLDSKDYTNLFGYIATLLNGYDTTIIITRYSIGDPDTTMIHASRQIEYNECDDWVLTHKDVYIIATTIDSFTFGYGMNYAQLNIIKP